jgi:hypothetical protein
VNRIVYRPLVTAAAVVLAVALPSAQKPAKIDACSLLTKAEVKEYLPWPAHVDSLPVEREDMGETGSACEYPTVRVQVLPYSRGFIDAAHKSRKPEPVTGVGDEAYISANRRYYAELVAKVGPRLLTLQASIPSEGTYESTKPKTIALAKALAAKLTAR